MHKEKAMYVRTHQEGGHLQVKEIGLRQNHLISWSSTSNLQHCKEKPCCSSYPICGILLIKALAHFYVKS